MLVGHKLGEVIYLVVLALGTEISDVDIFNHNFFEGANLPWRFSAAVVFGGPSAPTLTGWITLKTCLKFSVFVLEVLGAFFVTK
jgi:hypothetical protein